MKKILLMLAVLALAANPLHAEVLIYKGKGTVKITPGSPIPPKIEIYLLFDFGTKQIASLIYFKGNGVKRQIPGAPSDIDTTTSPQAGGGNVRLIADGRTDSNPPDFSHNFLFLRGIQKPLIVDTTGVGITLNEPRALTGFSVSAQESTGTGSFLDLRINVNYQQVATVAANNADKTLQQAFDDLSAKLTEQGFEAS